MKYPWYKKINPLWWFGNANDPVDGIEWLNGLPKPNHPGFHPEKPLWIRKILWGIRNPLHNLFFFVIGLEDQKGLVNAFIEQWPGFAQKWNIILPFICYKGSKWEWYAGWRHGTCLGFAFRHANAKPQ